MIVAHVHDESDRSEAGMGNAKIVFKGWSEIRLTNYM